MRMPALCFCFVVHAGLYVWSVAQGLTWWVKGHEGLGFVAFTIAGLQLAGLYHDVAVAGVKLDEMVRTLGDDVAPPGPPRGQE